MTGHKADALCCSCGTLRKVTPPPAYWPREWDHEAKTCLLKCAPCQAMTRHVLTNMNPLPPVIPECPAWCMVDHRWGRPEDGWWSSHHEAWCGPLSVIQQVSVSRRQQVRTSQPIIVEDEPYAFSKLEDPEAARTMAAHLAHAIDVLETARVCAPFGPWLPDSLRFWAGDRGKPWRGSLRVDAHRKGAR